jgi:3-oxoacyl-[acyl-carrier protein] reductase
MIPLGRFGQIDDIAFMVVVLASNHAGYITGQVIPVNGGIYM